MKRQDAGEPLAADKAINETDESANQNVSTIKSISIVFDEAKSARNLRERDLPFSMVERFNFETAHFELDKRKDYQEQRYVALGFLGYRLHVLCFTPAGNGIRVISFRKANPREIRFYEKTRTID